ncbi:MAG: hypothetical protein LBS06_02550, partial [Treponema sp.]|nr:hypothetical protein [Treponema sp.]
MIANKYLRETHLFHFVLPVLALLCFTVPPLIRHVKVFMRDKRIGNDFSCPEAPPRLGSWVWACESNILLYIFGSFVHTLNRDLMKPPGVFYKEFVQKLKFLN